MRNGGGQLFAAIAAVAEDFRQCRNIAFHEFDEVGGAVPILDVGRVHNRIQNVAHCIRDDVTFAPLTFLPAS